MEKPVRIRPPFTTRRVLLRKPMQVETLIKLLPHLPLDDDFPLEVLIREEVKPRTPSQNDLMWAGPLKDISEQGWANGRQLSIDAWHYIFRMWYLPDPAAPDFDKTHVTDWETYRKWETLPDGERILVGSTKRLSVKGFSIYLEQIYAYGATELGVEFSANPNEQRRAA